LGVRLESRRELPEAPVTEIVALLEPSVLAIAVELEKEAKEKADTMNQMLDNIDDREVEDMIDRIFDTEDGNEDDDNFDSDDDDADDDYDEDVGVMMLSSPNIDPFDQAVNAILTKRVKDLKAKAVFAHLVNAAVAKPTIPLVINVQTLPTDSEEADEKDLDYWADDSSSSNSESEEDEAEDGEVGIRLYGRRNQFRIPDVTAQVIRLNGGHDLMFTRRYEEIMWMKETGAEDVDVMERIYYSRNRLDVPDDEDDSDDDDDDS
jgi:hypothetical protein